MKTWPALLLFALACTDPPAEGEGEGEEGEGEGDEGEIANPFGFVMRAPVDVVLACEVDEFSCPDGSFTGQEKAYVCSFAADVVYVHATPTGLNAAGFPFPVYDDVSGFISRDGVVSAVDASYDYGGNHHNDFFSLTIDGARVTWDHSSYGFGFRACQPPDCTRVEGAGGEFVDGCADRSVPEACIAVVDPLPELVDNFARCNGDNG